jgi:hypothetical protein
MMNKKNATRRVQKCVAEIRVHLPQLENAPAPLVVIAALNEYLSAPRRHAC